MPRVFAEQRMQGCANARSAVENFDRLSIVQPLWCKDNHSTARRKCLWKRLAYSARVC